jgi:5-methylcytosine-specific restriction endonuclease McrA
MNSPVLVLNAAYEPINIASAKRAMNLLVKGTAVIELERDRNIHRGYRMPSVVRLSEYQRLPHFTVLPNRETLFLRDGQSCQYCSKELSSKSFTLDHVVPRAQGGASTWENLVTSCHECNHTKADRTPEQAGMPLLRKPRSLNIHTGRHMLRMMGSADPNWRKYLYHS